MRAIQSFLNSFKSSYQKWKNFRKNESHYFSSFLMHFNKNIVKRWFTTSKEVLICAHFIWSVSGEYFLFYDRCVKRERGQRIKNWHWIVVNFNMFNSFVNTGIQTWIGLILFQFFQNPWNKHIIFQSKRWIKNHYDPLNRKVNKLFWLSNMPKSVKSVKPFVKPSEGWFTLISSSWRMN